MEERLVEIWEELNNKLYMFIRKRIRSDQDAEDMLQDIYIKLHNNISKIRDEEKITSWIYQITRNTINDCYRKCYRVKNIEFEEKYMELTIDEEINLNDEVTVSMKRFIKSLPENSKNMIELYEFEGLSHKEISSKLGINENTSKSRLKRAKEKLRKELDDCCVFQIDKFGNVIDFEKRCCNKK